MRPALLAIVLLAAPAFAEFKRLFAERATASSFLESNWNKYQENYHPSYVLDDDPKTAWVEGAEGDGVGESLTVRLSALRSARELKLVITPGYQKSKGLFAANGAPTGLAVTVRDLSGAQTAAKDLLVKPVMGAQTFEVPVKGGLASVTLTLTAVRAGTKYRDTCLSDVQFFVDSDTPWDQRVENAKRAALMRWKVERLATAKFFASLPRTYPFPSSRYVEKSVVSSTVVSRRWKSLEVKADGTVVEVASPDFVELEALLASPRLPSPLDEEDATLVKQLLSARQEQRGRWFSVATKPAVLLPDALDVVFPTPARRYLQREDVTLFESKVTRAEVKLVAVREPGEDNGFAMASEGQSDLLLLEGTPQEPRLAAFLFESLHQVRVDTHSTRWVLLRWATSGRLDRVVMVSREAEGENATPHTVEATVWRLSPDGTLERRTVLGSDSRYSEVMERSADDGLWVEAARYEPLPR